MTTSIWGETGYVKLELTSRFSAGPVDQKTLER